MEGNITHTTITSYGYGTLRLKEGPNQLGHIFSTLSIYFIQFFSLIYYSLRDPITYAPEFFIFTTPLCDPILRLHLRLPFATPICDSTRDSHLRLPFATLLVTPICDSLFFVTSPSCNSTTDGRTVSTPQRHLPSIPTLTLIIKKFFWNLLPCLASTSSYCPPSCPPPLVVLCLLTRPLAHHLLQRPLPPLPGPLPTSPHLSHPLPLPPFPLYGNMSLQF